MLCAGISRVVSKGPTVAFCSPQKDCITLKDLNRGNRKGLPYVVLYVHPLSRDEMLHMKANLPECQVRGTLSPVAVPLDHHWLCTW